MTFYLPLVTWGHTFVSLGCVLLEKIRDSWDKKVCYIFKNSVDFWVENISQLFLLFKERCCVGFLVDCFSVYLWSD